MTTEVWPTGADVFTVVDLADPAPPVFAPLAGVVVAVARGAVPDAVPEHVDVLLTDAATEVAAGRAAVQVPDLDAAVAGLRAVVDHAPCAAAALTALLRQTELLPVPLGLAAESAVYSTLLAGPEFAAWRAARPVRPVPPSADPVLVERTDDVLTITLNRPERRNAFGVAVRDGLDEALDLAIADTSITEVVLRGAGAAFCSGGDLDEFGSFTDVASAHLVRLDRSAGARVHALRQRVTARVHGACIGAGVELPSFAGRVVAAPDARFRLPELSMGLVPGAGGTVSLTHRIGRHRTAWLALSGVDLDATDALAWGLVDALDG